MNIHRRSGSSQGSSSCSPCLWGILQHVVHLSRPDLQKSTIRILIMAPIYSLISWERLHWPDHALYLDTTQDFYVAFVTYTFIGPLVNFLKAQYPNLKAILEAKGKQRFHFPLCWCPPHPTGERVLCRCVALQPLFTYTTPMQAGSAAIYHHQTLQHHRC